MKKANLWLLGLILIFILPISLNAAQKIYKIGALLPITGNLSNLGLGNKAAIEIAVAEANKYYPEIGNNVKFQLIIKDTKASPNIALAELKSFQKKGIKVVIGPVASSELVKTKDFARENQIMLISGSAGPYLTTPADTVFRFQLNDIHQAKAYGYLMPQDKMQKMYFIVRNDIWGKGLYDETVKALKVNKKITLEAPIFYDGNTQNFNDIIKNLDSKIKSTGPNIGIQLIAFEEGVQILALASNNKKLSEVKWYGNNVMAKSNVLITNQKAAEFANKTHFTCALYDNPDNKDLHATIDKIQKKIGFIPSTHSVVMYDAMWVVINALMHEPDDKHLKTELMYRAQFYHGATGWTVLDENGDRKYGMYDFWQIQKEKNKYQWKIIGTFQINESKEH